jgi:ATP-dependent Clp protease adapter protein ClpS
LDKIIVKQVKITINYQRVNNKCKIANLIKFKKNRRVIKKNAINNTKKYIVSVIKKLFRMKLSTSNKRTLSPNLWSKNHSKSSNNK